MNILDPKTKLLPWLELTNFWSELSGQSHDELLQSAEFLECRSGSQIEVDFGLVIGGTIGLEYAIGDGRRSFAELFRSGDLMSMSRTERLPQGSLIALSDCAMLVISRADFDACLRHHEDALEAYARQIGDQTGRLRDHINDLATKTPLERIASVLFELRRWPGAGADNATEIALPLLHKDIAAYTGMKPETVSRTLRRLKDAKLIATGDLEGEAITLLNTPALRRIANGGAPRGNGTLAGSGSNGGKSKARKTRR